MRKNKKRILSLMLALVMVFSQFTDVSVVRAEEQIGSEGGGWKQ